jgi:hypothetical protein
MDVKSKHLEEIRRQKRMKMLHLARNRDIIQINKEIAENYREVKQEMMKSV